MFAQDAMQCLDRVANMQVLVVCPVYIQEMASSLDHRV